LVRGRSDGNEVAGARARDLTVGQTEVDEVKCEDLESDERTINEDDRSRLPLGSHLETCHCQRFPIGGLLVAILSGHGDAI